MNDRILKLPAVLERVPRSKTAIYADMKAGKFPQAIKLSTRSIGWRESDIEEWINSRASSAN
jgi:prophage regulatory protein